MNTEERKTYYVYFHKLDNEIVYIGSGTSFRFSSKHCRSKDHLDVWDSIDKQIVFDNLTKEESLNKEQNLINQHWESGLLFNRRKKIGKVKVISLEEISKFVYYDESSKSCLRRKVTMGFLAPKDAEAGCLNSRGYYQVRINGTMYRTHRVIYSLCHGVDLDPLMVIDHIDNNSSNNKISNLRQVSYSDNSRNKQHRKSNVNLQCINERIKNSCFYVNLRKDFKTFKSTFSYTKYPNKRTVNHYPTRELALEAAIAYRDSLVQQGLIVLTQNKPKEPNVSNSRPNSRYPNGGC